MAPTAAGFCDRIRARSHRGSHAGVIRVEDLGGRHVRVAALACVGTLTFLIYRLGGAEFVAFTLRRAQGGPEATLIQIVDYYLSIFLAPLILLVSAVLTALMGYLLLRASGASGREVIPVQDFPLLSNLLFTGNERGIDNYIRLSSLQGLTGLFTKVGLTGLPLATIALTLFFAVLAMFSEPFVDLAKLTLGAFLGSYVQRNIPASRSEPGEAGGRGV